MKKKNDDTTSTPTYSILGESGLAVDKEGNIFSASDTDDSEGGKKDTKETTTSKSFHNSSFVSELDDKANPAYWYYYYDERYCGQSREAYMEEMAQRYRNTRKAEEEKVAASKAPEASAAEHCSIPEEAIRKADRDQREAEREGLRPDCHRYSNSISSWGMVNRHNEVIISYDEYGHIGFFHNGLARVFKRKTKLFGFVDTHGKEVIPCTWKAAGEFNEYMAGVQDENKKCGFIDVTGRVVIPCEWENTWPFHDGLAIVQDKGKIGFIDKSGKLVIPCEWKKAEPFKNGVARVSKTNSLFRKDKWVYINLQGQVLKQD